jgi:hypothetical protein
MRNSNVDKTLVDFSTYTVLSARSQGRDGFLTGSTRLAMIVGFSSVVAIEKVCVYVCKAKINMIIITIMTKHDKMGHGWPGVHEVK